MWTTQDPSEEALAVSQRSKMSLPPWFQVSAVSCRGGDGGDLCFSFYKSPFGMWHMAFDMLRVP